jgi:hypothetical protein
MWKNFRDVRAIAEKISSVVAPQHDGSEYEEYSEEEGEEIHDDNEDEEYSESEEVEEPIVRSPFGFVDMISRAMDSEQQNYNESHSNEHEEADYEHVDLLPEEKEEEIDFQTSRLSPVESSLSPNSSHRLATMIRQHHAPTSPVEDGVGSDDSLHSKNDPVISPSFSSKIEQTRGRASSRKILGRDDSVNTYSSVMTPPVVDHESEHEPEPARFSLVRESGSLSPQRKPKASTGGLMGALPPPLSTRSLGSTPSGAEVALSPLKDILYAQQQQQIIASASTAITEQSCVEPAKLPRDALLGSFSVANKEGEEERLEEAQTDTLPVIQPPVLAFVSKGETKPDTGVTSDNDQQRCTKRADSGFLRKSSSVVSGTSSLASVTLDAMHEEEEEEVSESAHHVASQPNFETMGGTTNQEPHVPAVRPASVETDPAHENGNGGSKLSVAGAGEQAKRIEKLEKRCKELKKQLGNAENHIIELQQQASNIVEHDNSEHEQLMQHFHEKEARLLQAAAEEHEQEMKALRNAMDEKITSMQRQLVKERNAFQQDREHMTILLSEANARTEKIERQARDERSKSEKATSQIQQQQARALRMVEDKLAQTMALLDERDENVKHLKDVVKSLESNMTEHKEGVQEAEEEMDELHSENEALHNHVESLQTECSELRKKVAKLEGDSEKLVHLKVKSRLDCVPPVCS